MAFDQHGQTVLLDEHPVDRLLSLVGEDESRFDARTGVHYEFIGAGTLSRPMTDTDAEAVPVEELEALVDDFRELADDRMSLGLIEASDGINECADKLEALIEDEA